MTPLPPEARLPLRLYRLLFLPVLLAMLPGFALRMIRRGNYRARFGERFGRYTPEAHARLAVGGWTWVHAVSVGEMMMALKLADALRTARPGLRLLLSTTTSTGNAVALQALERLRPEIEAAGGEIALVYYPIDFQPGVRRALDLIRPERVILIDKELWPNLIAGCYTRGTPVSIVNARLSPRSERRFTRFKRWVGPFFGMLDRVCVQEAEDAAAWQRLGVRPEAVVHTGSPKFDYPEPTLPSETIRQLWESLAIRGPVLIAGSTFAGEETLLARVYERLRRDWPGLYLILVPRHAERCSEVEKALVAMGLQPVRRSRLPATDQGDLLLVDSTGELTQWYALADLCFVGKSLAPEISGGQNPAEPLLAGKPVVFGSGMENFAWLARRLVECGGARQVCDEAELEAAFRALLADETARQTSVDAGRAVLAPHRGATERIVRVLFRESA